jgi:hypothetical protein
LPAGRGYVIWQGVTMQTTRGNADAIALIKDILKGAESIAKLDYAAVRHAAEKDTRRGLVEIATEFTADVVEVRSITGNLVSNGTLIEALTDWAAINAYGPAIERLIALHVRHLALLRAYQRWYRDQGWLEFGSDESDERRAAFGETTDDLVRFCRMLVKAIPTVWPPHLIDALTGIEKRLALEMNRRGGSVPITEFAVIPGWSTDPLYSKSLRDSAGGVRSRFNQILERLKIDARISCADGEFRVVEPTPNKEKKK